MDHNPYKRRDRTFDADFVGSDYRDTFRHLRHHLHHDSYGRERYVHESVSPSTPRLTGVQNDSVSVVSDATNSPTGDAVSGKGIIPVDSLSVNTLTFGEAQR